MKIKEHVYLSTIFHFSIWKIVFSFFQLNKEGYEEEIRKLKLLLNHSIISKVMSYVI